MTEFPKFLCRKSVVLFSLAIMMFSPVHAMAEVTLTPAELENYQFRNREKEVKARVSDLTLGQQYTLDNQRRSIEEMMSRRLGMQKLKGTRDDLKIFQQLVDRRVIKPASIREWQALGVVFGDVLANEFGLHWVSYEDDLGVSKALQWKNTDNFVFPVTLFSKRVQFREKIDVAKIFGKIEQDIAAFKRYEEIHDRIGS